MKYLASFPYKLLQTLGDIIWWIVLFSIYEACEILETKMSTSISCEPMLKVCNILWLTFLFAFEVTLQSVLIWQKNVLILCWYLDVFQLLKKYFRNCIHIAYFAESGGFFCNCKMRAVFSISKNPLRIIHITWTNLEAMIWYRKNI